MDPKSKKRPATTARRDWRKIGRAALRWSWAIAIALLMLLGGVFVATSGLLLYLYPEEMIYKWMTGLREDVLADPASAGFFEVQLANFISSIHLSPRLAATFSGAAGSLTIALAVIAKMRDKIKACWAQLKEYVRGAGDSGRPGILDMFPLGYASSVICLALTLTCHTTQKLADPGGAEDRRALADASFVAADIRQSQASQAAALDAIAQALGSGALDRGALDALDRHLSDLTGECLDQLAILGNAARFSGPAAEAAADPTFPEAASFVQFNGANLAQSKLAQQIAGLRESMLARRAGERALPLRALAAAVRRSLEADGSDVARGTAGLNHAWAARLGELDLASALAPPAGSPPSGSPGSAGSGSASEAAAATASDPIFAAAAVDRLNRSLYLAGSLRPAAAPPRPAPDIDAQAWIGAPLRDVLRGAKPDREKAEAGAEAMRDAYAGGGRFGARRDAGEPLDLSPVEFKIALIRVAKKMMARENSLAQREFEISGLALAPNQGGGDAAGPPPDLTNAEVARRLADAKAEILDAGSAHADRLGERFAPLPTRDELKALLAGEPVPEPPPPAAEDPQAAERLPSLVFYVFHDLGLPDSKDPDLSLSPEQRGSIKELALAISEFEAVDHPGHKLAGIEIVGFASAEPFAESFDNPKENRDLANRRAALVEKIFKASASDDVTDLTEITEWKTFEEMADERLLSIVKDPGAPRKWALTEANRRTEIRIYLDEAKPSGR